MVLLKQSSQLARVLLLKPGVMDAIEGRLPIPRSSKAADMRASIKSISPEKMNQLENNPSCDALHGERLWDNPQEMGVPE
jgi:hypothetical protein